MYEFSRTELLIGAESISTLKDATVMIFGVGGVGSHCIEALARTGVGHLILIDNDTVSLTNLNRQSIAYHSTIGQYKTQIMKQRIADICPDIQVDTFESFVLPENINDFFCLKDEHGNLLPRKIDYVIDAIDTVTAKLALVEQCNKQEIPLLSSMGTGNKLHPERFQITDISQTSMCPLCKVMRKELKARNIYHLTVLYSDERPVDTTARSTDEDKGQRRSLPGSIAFVPPVAGLLIAGYVVRRLCGITD